MKILSPSECLWCAQIVHPAADFCSRCGGRLAEEPQEEKFLYRLRLIEKLVRSASQSGFSATDQVRRQVAAARGLTEQDADLTRRCQAALDGLAQALLGLPAGCDLTTWLKNIELVLQLYPSTSATDLRSLHAALQEMVNKLKGVEKQFVEGKKATRDKLVTWQTQKAAAVGWTPEQVHAAVFAAPQHWPRLAGILDAEALRKAKPLLLVAQGQAALREKKFGAAQNHFQAALAADPACLAAMEGFALAHVRLDQLPQAIACYRKAAAHGIANPTTCNNLAWYLCKAGLAPEDHALALWAARRAIDLAPLGSFWDTLAEVLEKIGDLPGALAATREGMRDDPDRDVYRKRMQDLCAKLPAALPPAACEQFELDSGCQFELSLDEEAVELALEDSCESGLGIVAESRTDMERSDFELEALDEAPGGAGERAPAAAGRTHRGVFAEAPPVQRDAVDCSVFAPGAAVPGTTFLVQVFAHVPADAAKVQAAAVEFDPEATRRGVAALATEVARGSRLTFELKMPRLMVDPMTMDLIWRGRPDSVQFEVTVPEALKPQTVIGTLLVSQDAAPIGAVKFKLSIVAEAPADNHPPAAPEARRYQSAFASYASPDRAEVVKRVQMLRAAGIRCFQDVLDLEPGDRWEKQLYRHIDESDVLFFFWSGSAKKSEWVEREWKYALQRKGEEFVRPVIIEGPPIVPPPPELAHLHFNDKVLYLLR